MKRVTPNIFRSIACIHKDKWL